MVYQSFDEYVFLIKMLLSVVSPMAVASVAIAVVVYFASGKKEENELEHEIKRLRQNLLRGDLGRTNFLYMKNSMQAEESYDVELKKLEEMFQQNLLDSTTYGRMRKALQVIYNEKLMKIHTNYQN